VWGEDNQYGRVDVPGTTVLHLPAGAVRVSVAIHLVGRGNQTPDLPLPSDLSLAVSPVNGSGQPVLTRVNESSSNANADDVNTQRQVWTVQIPQDGDYHVTAQGTFLGIGVNPQLWFGHGPPLPGTLVPVVAAGLVVVAYLVWFHLLPAINRRRGGVSAAPAPAGSGLGRASTTRPSDHLDRLAKLAALHERGALTDAEFAAEKAKIISEG
jgi:hypothetical protein